MQLLVDHRDTLEVTDLVPVGDLFDVLIHGDTVTDTDVVTHFENAEKLYHAKLLPMLETQHGMSREQISQLPPKDQLRKAFQTDDRLLKTLLLAALVPEVESLRGMTAERLAALNHGTISAPIVGGEVQTVSNKVKGWAAQVGEIRVSSDARNPSIAIVLTDVDTDSILKRAEAEDSYGNRVKIIRQIVFQEAMGIEEATLFEQGHDFAWRGIDREAQVVFRNVRDMSVDQLANAADDWKVVIDFPFDQQNFSPATISRSSTNAGGRRARQRRSAGCPPSSPSGRSTISAASLFSSMSSMATASTATPPTSRPPRGPRPTGSSKTSATPSAGSSSLR